MGLISSLTRPRYSFCPDEDAMAGQGKRDES